MSNKVEDFFIAPLEAHFESVPTDGSRETILEDFEQYAPDDLNEAVELLKRTRQAQKTFPSPKECIKAIKVIVGGRRQTPVIRGGAIDASNYATNAHAYIVDRGITKDVPVIKKDTAQWHEWIDYYRWLGVHWILADLDTRDSWTVPTLFPSQFDPRFNPAQAEPRRAA